MVDGILGDSQRLMQIIPSLAMITMPVPKQGADGMENNRIGDTGILG